MDFEFSDLFEFCFLAFGAFPVGWEKFWSYGVEELWKIEDGGTERRRVVGFGHSPDCRQGRDFEFGIYLVFVFCHLVLFLSVVRLGRLAPLWGYSLIDRLPLSMLMERGLGGEVIPSD